MRLGEMLVADGKLTQPNLDEALRNQQQRRGRLGTSLLELGLIEEEALLASLGRQRSTRTVSKSELSSISAAVIRMIPPKLALRYAMVPFELKGRTLFVASGNVGDALKEDEIGFLTSCMVRTCIGLELRIFEALHQHYGVKIPERYQSLAKDTGIGRQRAAEPARARQAAVAMPIPQALRSSPVSSSRPAVGSSSATQRLDSPATTTTPPPRASPPPPTLFIELDEEDAALLGRSSDYQPSPTVTGDEPVLLQPTPLPWLARKVEIDVATAAEPATEGAPGPAAPDSLDAPKTLGHELVVAETASASIAATSPIAASMLAESTAIGGQALASIRRETDLEERLQAAADELKHAEIRDDIADVLLAFSEPYLERRLLLVTRGDAIVGWRGEGSGVERDGVRAINLELNKPSVFLGLRSAESFWLGALPELPANRMVADGLGGAFPKDCLVLPVTLRSRVVCYFYGDNRAAGVSGSPLAELRRLAAMAALAFEVYILKNKMRLI